MNSYKLGLDIGSRSIGWALLETGMKPSIVDIGVRVFPEGVDRDTTGLEKSKNATRREARGARRVHQRRNLRRDQLVKTLKSAGLLPEDKEQLSELFKKEPYQLRAMGLDEKLDLYEFGRALFHINQRRGFKSNRKTGKVNENNKVAEEADELQKKIREASCRTLGDYFANVNPEENRIREQYTFRSMYEDEFDKLWTKQCGFYPEVLTEDLRKKIRDEIMFFQRPLKPTDDLIGLCELEPEEKCCPRGDWYARRFRMLQDVNNLRVCNPDGSMASLTPEQRRVLLEELNKKKEMKFTAIRNKLGLLETQEFNAEYKVNEKGKKNENLKGDAFSAAMRNNNIFGPKVCDTMYEAEKIKLNDWLVELEDDELTEKLACEYGLDEDQIENVRKISLPQRYMSFSRKAIQKLLPLMEKGKRTDEALDEVYPNRNKTGAIDEKNKLDLPGDLRNPIVNKALFEIRKIVNAIIREYGKPTKIALEMAREVRGNAKERRELHFKMLENENRNKETRKRLTEDLKIRNPSRDDIIKYNLWEECGHSCPYTGKHISQTAIFGENPEFQVEHILPYNRSLDDSYMNKTLCDVHENAHVKGDKTPYEAYSQDEEKYEQIKQRIKALPWPKRRRFLQKEISLDKCIERELNDTRYICKEVVKYLKQIGINVRGTKGRITAELRHQWGLNSILDLAIKDMKNRDDHRHHAIDAAVVSVTDNKHLHKLAQSKYSTTGHSFTQPWPNFREELAEKVKHINVSHRVTRKVSGALHEETAYGPTGKIDEKGQEYYVFRKKLEDITPAMIKKEKIVDTVVQQIIKDRLTEYGIDPEKAKKLPKEVWNEPLYMKTKKSKKKVPIKKVRIQDVFNNMILLKDKSGKPYRAVATGNNHHIEIFEYKDKKEQTKRDGKVITMFKAVQRSQRGESVVCRDYKNGKNFVCSLAQNELFMIYLNDDSTELHRVQKITQSGNNITITLRPHTYAGKVSDFDKPPLVQRRTPNTLKGHKVTVDMLGRVHLAND